jgi:signal transduction histidine kinase
MKGENNSMNNLEKSYARVNLYFIIVAFVTAIIVICGDGFVYYKHHYNFLFAINLALIILIFIDILLLFTEKMKVKAAFTIYLYTILLNITLTHLHEIKYNNFIASAIMVGFWGLLLIVVSGMALGKWHPYLVVIWAGALLFSDIIRTHNSFLIETCPIIFVTLIGISFGVSSYMNILRKSFQKNQDALAEISTQKNQIEEQAEALELNNRYLKELQNKQKDLIELLVHDMKNPLNSILINASKRSLRSDQKPIYEAGRQMLVLVENMLDIYRMEKVNPSLVLEEIHLAGTIQTACELVEFLVYQHGMSIEIQVDYHLFVKANHEILIRILVNLFTNAIKHSPDNSIITILSDAESNEYITISVKDQGEGIPELYKEKIFEKYVQVVSRKSGSSRSTGLGLTFCKMSIELMDGEIWIADSTSKGTTVSFTLPAAKSETYLKHGHSSKKKIQFLPEDVSLLKPIVLEIEKLELYKAGLIFSILGKINHKNKRTEKWVEDIKNAVCSSNHEKFKELLEMMN